MKGIERGMVVTTLHIASSVLSVECKRGDKSGMVCQCYDCIMGVSVSDLTIEVRHEYLSEINAMISSMYDDEGGLVYCSPKTMVEKLTNIQHHILAYRTLLDCPRYSVKHPTALATLIELIGSTIRALQSAPGADL